MKNFTKTINGKKYKGKAFERLDIINKFNQTENKWELIDNYQKKFPQLLIDDTSDFVINGEILCNELGVKDNFNDWLLSNRKSKQGKLIKYRCEEDKDYIVNLASDFREANKHGGNNKKIITLTLDCARKIAMRQNNEQGDLVCDYFILIEKILKDYEIWQVIREPEKQGFNRMKSAIKDWCIKNKYDATDNYFYIREANMLNEALTGLKAMDIRCIKSAKDNQTRDNLDREINQILSKLQDINISLLIENMSFEQRERIIKNTCKNQYAYIKDKFNN